jgi:hypothetical protein
MRAEASPPPSSCRPCPGGRGGLQMSTKFKEKMFISLFLRKKPPQSQGSKSQRWAKQNWKDWGEQKYHDRVAHIASNNVAETLCIPANMGCGWVPAIGFWEGGRAGRREGAPLLPTGMVLPSMSLISMVRSMVCVNRSNVGLASEGPWECQCVVWKHR